MQFVYLQCQNTANPSKCIDCRRMFNGCAVVIVMNSMKKKKKKATATATATATTIDTKKINSTKQKCTVCCAPTNFRCNTYTCSFSSMQTSHHEPCTQPFGHSIQKKFYSIRHIGTSSLGEKETIGQPYLQQHNNMTSERTM